MPTNSKQILSNVKKPFTALRTRIASYKTRRPHTSFRLTRRRDYKRSLELPGFFRFTGTVNKTLWKNRKIFIPLAIVYALLSSVLVGIGSQETYSALTSTLGDTGSEIFQGNLGEIGKASLLFVSIAGSGLSSTPTDIQQLYTIILGLLIWLTTVWLLRNILANHKVRMRDGLYSAGSPIVATFLVSLLFIIQLIPIALATIGYSAATASGLLNGGVAALLFWIVAILLCIMSLYWVTSTFFALIIVTLPGMYPAQALRTAGDMVIGRRLRILLRLLWMLLVIVVTWIVVTIPFILLDSGIKGLWPDLEFLPIIPVVLLILGVVSFIWSASYVYLLYRKVVDDDAKPA